MPDRHADDRGFFARTFCEQEFGAQGLNTRWVQCSVSHNRTKGTLRGMHYQTAPHAEIKLVRCTRGAIFDVMLDLRPGSATFRQWVGSDLTAENGWMHYIPEGVAHGFQTLEDDTEVSYAMSTSYAPSAGRCARWDDRAYGIKWPTADRRILSVHDATAPAEEH